MDQLISTIFQFKAWRLAVGFSAVVFITAILVFFKILQPDHLFISIFIISPSVGLLWEMTKRSARLEKNAEPISKPIAIIGLTFVFIVWASVGSAIMEIFT